MALKVVIDVLGSTEQSGGMRLHATQIVTAWSKSFPADAITVVGPKWSEFEFASLQNVRVVGWRNEKVWSRAFGQVVVTALVTLAKRAPVLISLSPVVSPLVPRKRSICFEHDWRHKKVPSEFGIAQRAYRKLWEISAGRARAVVCISDKTEKETKAIVPSARTVIIPNGYDHARDWANLDAPDGPRNAVVTFGHHNNKRPELVIGALAELKHPGLESLRLIVLGAQGSYREKLSRYAQDQGVAHRVEFPGFVSDREYQRLIRSADVVVMASSDEGFGLPIAEAQYFGIPAVVTTDSGLEDIHGESVISAAPDAHSLSKALAAAVSLGVRPDESQRTLHSWDRTVHALRRIAKTDSGAVR